MPGALWKRPRWLVALVACVTLAFLWLGSGAGGFHLLDLVVALVAVLLGGVASWWGASRSRSWSPGETNEDPLWDGSLAAIVFGALACSFITGFVATSGPRIEPARGGAMLLHILLMPAMLVPMTLYTVRHMTRERSALRSGHWNAIAGIGLVVTWVAVVLTGAAGVSFGARSGLVSLHVHHHLFAAILGLFCLVHLAGAFVRHRRIRRLFLLGGGGGLFAAAVFSFGSQFLEPRLPWIQADDVYGEDTPLQRAPMQAQSSARKFLNRSMSCADPEGCHAGIAAQWRASAHGQAGIDPLFTKVRGIMEAELGRETARDACDICHAPVRHAGLNTPDAETHGVGCLHCHSLPSLDQPEHMGLELVDPPPGFLLEDVLHPLVSRLSYLVVLASGGEHKALWDDRDPGAPATCGVCHEDRVGDGIFQDNFSTWKSGPFGPGSGSERECASCHMPMEMARDVSSSAEGEVFSHRFAAANLWLPGLQGDQVQAEAVRAHLRSGGFDLEMSVAAGSLEVGLVTRRVGHVFPGGVADLVQSEVVAEGRYPGDEEWTPLIAGPRERCVPETEGAARVGVTIRDMWGNDLVKHEVWRVLGTRWGCARVSPGEPRYVKFGLPEERSPGMEFRARWTYRSISQELAEWAVPGSVSPQVILAETEWTQGDLHSRD